MRAVAGSGAVQGAAMLATFAVGVQLARGLGVSGYGEYGLALAVITLASIPGELGLSKLVTREVSIASASHNWSHVFAALRWADSMALRISAVVVLMLAVAALALFSDGDSAFSMAVLAGIASIPLFSLARIRGGALQGLRYVVLGQIPPILLRSLIYSLVLAIGFAAQPNIGPTAAMALYSLTAAAVLIATDMLLRGRLPQKPTNAIFVENHGWLGSSVAMALTDGMFTLQRELSILIIGILAAPAAVGLYRVGASTAYAAAVAILVVNVVALPIIARLHAERDHIRLQKAVTRFAQTQFAGVFLISLPLMIAAEPLLGLVFGRSFESAATVLRILLAGQVLNAAFGPNVALLNMTHHERRVTRAMAIGLAVNVVGVLSLTVLAGPAGAAMGVVAALFSWNIILWRDAKKLLQIDTFLFPTKSRA